MIKGPSKWKTLKFEEMGAEIPNLDFEGLVGIEECHDYGVTTSKTRNKKKNAKRKREAEKLEKSPKKVKSTFEGEFKVESINEKITPSRDNEIKPPKNKKKNASKFNNLQNDDNCIPLDQMQAWSTFALPEPILKALADQGFKQPTLIQELTLPAAMHGRRDILGAAETGSGKTLAFGIPIISGVLDLKGKISRGEIEKPRRSTPRLSEDKAKPKIINMNKMSKKEIKELRNLNKKSKKMKPYEDGSDSEIDEFSENNDSDASDVINDSDIDEDPSDDSENDEESSDDSENDGESSNNSENDRESLNESESDDNELNEDSDNSISNLDKFAFNENGKSDELDDQNLSNDQDVDEDNCILDSKINKINEKEIIAMEYDSKPLFALILTPTRELAIQVKNHLVAAAKHTDLRIAVVVGGMAQVKQERILLKCPEIVVATPGRLWEMIQQGNEHLSKVTDIRFLAIDETDRMIERGHFEELHHLLDKINDNEHKRLQRQNFVFSATLTMVHDLPSHLKTKKVTKKGKIINKKVTKLTPEQKLEKVVGMLGITNPKIVDVTVKNQGSSNTLMECRITCPIDHKDYYLYYVLKKHPGRTIVFCNSIGCVKRLTQLFGLLLCNPMPIHASMQQRQRLKNLDRFRDHPLGLLIATDVAARGLDIPNVEHVIHYQVPRTAENYVHRSGRTARASKEGITILIMEPGEIQNYTKMCRTLSKTEDLPHFPIINPFLTATKQRVDLARELDQFEYRMKKANTEIGWYEKQMREMDIVLDEGERPRKIEKDVAAEQKSILTIKKKQLNGLLSAPLFPKGFSFKYPTGDDMDENFGFGKTQNALEAMKSAIESGAVKKVKKNDEFVPLEAQLSNYNNLKKSKVERSKKTKDKLLSKNKWKKMKRK